MIKNEKLSSVQAVYLIAICRLVIAYIYLPAIDTPPANQDIILSFVYMSVLCAPILYLSSKFSDMTPIQYSQKILGKYPGKLLGLLYTAFILFGCLLHLVMITVFLGSLIIPETPMYAIMIFMLVICIYTAYKGIECIGRTSEIFVPLIFMITVIFSLLSINNMNFNVFLPVFKDSSFFEINYCAFSIASRFSDVIILCMLVPNINKKGNINKIFFASITLIVLFLMICILSVQSVFGIEMTIHANFPYFLFIRQIAVFDFIERIESFYLIIWVFGVCIKVSVNLYFASIAAAQIFKSKSNKVFIIPMAIIIFIIALATQISKSAVYNKIVSYEVFPFISFPYIFIIPLMLLIICFLRRKSFDT